MPKKITKKTPRKDYAKMALTLHKKLKGKIEVVSKGKLITKDDWSMMYTPGAGAVPPSLANNPKEEPR